MLFLIFVPEFIDGTGIFLPLLRNSAVSLGKTFGNFLVLFLIFVPELINGTGVFLLQPRNSTFSLGKTMEYFFFKDITIFTNIQDIFCIILLIVYKEIL